MTFWQENYPFVKEVYEMRHQKLAEWMENVEKSIARIMADKVYTSAEFKRERDNFNALCKDLEKAEVTKWLNQILEILMAEKAKSMKQEENEKLDNTISIHKNLVPTVMKTQVMVDLYWKCYAYGDELKPHIEFLDGIMMSSTREIAPSCVENVDELIERQEKSLIQLEAKRSVCKDLIEKGKVILQNPDKPKFLESHVSRIELGWEDTTIKAKERLKLLTETKEAWVGYVENSEVIVTEFDKAEEEIKKVKKRFNLANANSDLKKRQDIFAHTKKTIGNLDQALTDNCNCMSITMPADKKKLVEKEVKTLRERLNVVDTFHETVSVVEKFVNALTEFDVSLKTMDAWMKKATEELNDIKNCSANMAPEDRVARTMELQEDISSKVEIIKAETQKELTLLPQGDKVPADAQEYKNELKRITEYVANLQKNVGVECDKYSEDVKFWAEYKTGIKEFCPWLASMETASKEGLVKPTNLEEAKALQAKVHGFAKSCVDHLALLNAANSAAQKMTSHEVADTEVAALKERYTVVKAVADEWVKKVDVLAKEWTLLDNTVSELNSWVAKDKTAEGENQFSLEKMECTLGELKNIYKEKEKLVENL